MLIKPMTRNIQSKTVSSQSLRTNSNQRRQRTLILWEKYKVHYFILLGLCLLMFLPFQTETKQQRLLAGAINSGSFAGAIYLIYVIEIGRARLRKELPDREVSED
jgi:hypothetical protein